ncbi:MAG: helix-turn-helix domain-containing protein, partial [Polyangiales bacterium]
MSGANIRSRGRPRLFDEGAVLDELTALFWRKGYSQTSMADLVDASGVHKSSLYSTFGTKE